MCIEGVLLMPDKPQWPPAPCPTITAPCATRRLAASLVPSMEALRVQELSFVRVQRSSGFVLGGRGCIKGLGGKWCGPARTSFRPSSTLNSLRAAEELERANLFLPSAPDTRRLPGAWTRKARYTKLLGFGSVIDGPAARALQRGGDGVVPSSASSLSL